MTGGFDPDGRAGEVPPRRSAAPTPGECSWPMESPRLRWPVQRVLSHQTAAMEIGGARDRSISTYHPQLPLACVSGNEKEAHLGI